MELPGPACVGKFVKGGQYPNIAVYKKVGNTNKHIFEGKQNRGLTGE